MFILSEVVALHKLGHPIIKLLENYGFIVRHVPPGPLSGGHIPDPQDSGNRSSSQAGWDYSPRPYSDRRSQLDGVLCHHRKSCCRSLRSGWVLVSVSWPIDRKIKVWDLPAARRGHRDITGVGPCRRVCGGFPPDGTGHTYGGVAVSAPIHCQWDGVRGAVFNVD